MTTATPTAPVTTRTVPSPAAVADALSRLLRAFPPPAVAEYATRHAAASRTCRELSASTDWMAPAEFDRLADVQDELAMYRSQMGGAA
ncbi:hypothetical protein [Streptomyces prasinus]|uniref:hypothetical protein n=1 Tax=Streptomyces prasinus TaxID=67345 RepID=UPI0033BD22BC